ncbi:ABC transporter ATP-binding protein [Thiolapillus brandeum]|uniref:Lipopolysaccharide transporter ATP-binding protein n=1 Tax=Thiolapillus brandeum TaxID=1076588 RepID=A0A7U6JHQ3_9GAMM|nr:ABC transporter ATP-binding protein [Thiolapillus brandeum]BAO43435.1 lipopolysaccharide transporter ATP-binding protein [Thiolapillus brandeum]
MNTVLTLENVGVAYRRGRNPWRGEQYWALRDVSLSLHHGETLGIIGRNGVGKTTLLRVIAGIIEPDTGRIRNNGVSASMLSLQVGFVPLLTGRENAILSGMLLGARKEQLETNMEELVAFAELQDFIDEPVASYSAGMRARLGFSVAMQADPDVLLIDEVLGVGDAAFRRKSSDEIHRRIRSNRSVILVSHNIGMMRSLCDRVLWIENGISRMQGDVKQVLDAYEADTG